MIVYSSMAISVPDKMRLHCRPTFLFVA